MAPSVPHLHLAPQRPGSSWLYEAFVVYDAADAKLRDRVDAIATQMVENGVRTFKNLNEPGSLTSRSVDIPARVSNGRSERSGPT